MKTKKELERVLQTRQGTVLKQSWKMMCKESKETVSFLFNRVLLTLANQARAENQMSRSHTDAMYVAGICDGCQARESA